MRARVLALFRAGLAQHWAGAAIPVAPLVVHGAFSACAALLVRGELGAQSFVLAMLALSAALVALPLLGDLAPLLRADPAQTWIEAQPVSPRELRLARSLVGATVVLFMAASSLVPMALLAPAEMGFAARAAFVALGLVQAVFVAAALMGLFALLGGRAESALLALQTLLFAAVVTGALLGLRSVRELAERADGAPWPAWFPPGWFADALRGEPVRAAFAACGALALLMLAPAAPASAATGRGPLGTLLAPLVSLGARRWARRDERASFELVARALPQERDVVLRTYPLLGIPLAFVAASGSEGGSQRDALVTLLLFMPPVWLPVLLVQVSASASSGARWLLDSSPADPDAMHAGARKAVALRFLLPLQLALGALAAWSASPTLALRLTPVAFLVALLLLRPLYRSCVHDLPLSRASDDTLVELDWTGTILGIGILQAVLAVLAWKYLDAWPAALAACLALLAAEVWTERRARAGKPDVAWLDPA